MRQIVSGTHCHLHSRQTAAVSPKKPSKSPSPKRPDQAPKNSAKPAKPAKPAKSPVKTKPAALVPSIPAPVFPARPRSPQKPRDYSKPGYIYLYTLASLLDSKSKNDWLKTRNLLLKSKHKDQWVTFNSKKLLVLLVKVGMTTQTVAKRILQWEAKCHHKLVCLHPDHPSTPRKPLSFLQRFANLKVDDQYATFQDNVKGFFVPRDVLRAEKEIHGALKERYGRGDVYCTGCVEKAKHEHKESSILDLFRKKEVLQSDYNVHVEWFPIPKKNLHDVYKIIDSICLRYLP